MPTTIEQLAEKQEQSLKLINKMLHPETGLEAQIKALKDEGGGVAELKEKVNKMAEENAAAIDEIKTLTEKVRDEDLVKVREELEARQDEFETKHARSNTGSPGGFQRIDFGQKVYDRFAGLGEGEGQLQRAIKSKQFATVKSLIGGSKVVTIEDGAEQFLYAVKAHLKAVTALAASGGDTIIPVYEPQIIRPGEQPITLLDVLPRATTMSPLIYWVVEVLGSRTDNTGIQSLDFTGTDQGTALGESDFVFNQLSAETRTFGHTAKIALQLLEDVGQLRGYLDNIMRYMVRYNLEGQILGGDGTGKNISGLKTQGTAFDTTLDTALGVTNQQNLDVIRIAIHQCALTFFPATATILHPQEATGLELLKDGDQRYLFVMNPNAAQAIRPWGVPVVSTTQQTADDFTVGAMNQCEVVIRKEIDVMVSTENEDDFDKELGTMKATGRFGLKTYQPGSIIEGDFTSAKL